MPMKQGNFGRHLRAVIPEIKDRQKTVNDKKVRLYVGIALACDMEWHGLAQLEQVEHAWGNCGRHSKGGNHDVDQQVE